MAMLTPLHIIGILLTIGILLAVSVLSGRKVRDARSFTTGGKAGSWMVCGAIMGTLVGGQSTIGTAQLAFHFGLSAWWFTLGAAFGSLMLGLFMAGPLRRTGCTTLTEVIGHEFGRRAAAVGSVLCLLGIFISIMSQILASSAMMTSLFNAPVLPAAVVSATLIMLFVLFGGIKSAGAGGIVKMVLLYISSLVAVGYVWYLAEDGLFSSLDEMGQVVPVTGRYNSLVARGPMKDIGSCLSLALGVLSTQTYAQGIWSAATTRKARRGAVLCSLLIPVVGAACTAVGIYMRGHYITAAEYEVLLASGGTLPEGVGVIASSAQAFPTFILDCIPSWLGGIALGTLFVTILGGGSGLALGAATILVRDVITPIMAWRGRVSSSVQTPGTSVYRVCIMALLLAAVVAALTFHGTFINDLGFLSLGLRATAILLPLLAALFWPGSFTMRSAVASMIAGTTAMILAKFLVLPADPVFWGMGVGMAVMAFGYRKRK